MSLTPKSVRDGWHKDQRIEQQNTREVTKEHVHNWSLKKFTLSTGLTITGTDLEAVYPLWWKMEISYLSKSSHLKEKLMKINVTSQYGHELYQNQSFPYYPPDICDSSQGALQFVMVSIWSVCNRLVLEMTCLQLVVLLCEAAETLWVDIDGGSRSLGYDFKSHTGSLVFFLSLLTVCMSWVTLLCHIYPLPQ